MFRAQSDLSQQVWILMLLGLAHELQDDTSRAIVCHDEALAITEDHSESVNR